MKEKSLKINMIMSVLLSGASVMFPLFSYPYASRILGPEGIGKVNFANSIINYFLGFSQLGIPIYGVRICAQVRNDKEKLLKTIKELLTINLLLSAISYVILSFCVLMIPKMHAESRLYWILSSTLLLQALGVEWYYKSIEEYSYITIRSLICKVIALVSLFLLVKNSTDYEIYGLISILASSLSCVFNFVHARKYIFCSVNEKLEFTKHIKPILIIYAMSLASSIYSNLDSVMLGFMKNDYEVGLYTTSIKVKTILISVITAGASVLLPRVSYLLNNEEFNEYEHTCKKSFRFILIVSLPITIFFAIFSRECIDVLAGKEFLESVKPMIILMPTVMIIGFTYNMGMEMLISAGKEIAVFWASCGGAIADLTINLLLIPIWGATGAAIGTLFAEAVVLLIEYSFIRKIDYMKNTLKGLPWWKSLAAVLLGILASIWIKWTSLSPLAVLSIAAIVFFGFYFLVEILLKEPLINEIFIIAKKKIGGKE